MPAAYLPSPATPLWHLGAIPIRGYALCMVAAVLAGLWLTDWRYRNAGGEQGVVLRVATVAVPAALIGARAYTVLTSYHAYFGPGKDWTGVLRIWQGGLGTLGAFALGGLAALAYCRGTGVRPGKLALAAAPALAVTQAIAVWGNWFGQTFYGSPSTLPWAVDIAPQRRAAGYQAFATFQPVFAYESLADLLIAVGIGYAIRRYSLTGDRALAMLAAAYAAVRFCAEALRVDHSPQLLGVRTDQLAMLVVLVVSCSYLVARRRQGRRRTPAGSPGPAAGTVRGPAVH
jgi:prolipoprotein diacylglyceryltransferase